MVSREKLTDEEWSSIYAILLNNKRVYAILENKCRDFVNAVVWILRSGAQWRLLPVSQGKSIISINIIDFILTNL